MKYVGHITMKGICVSLLWSCAPAPQSDLSNTSSVKSSAAGNDGTAQGSGTTGSPSDGQQVNLGQVSSEKTIDNTENSSGLSCKLNASAAAAPVGGKIKLALVSTGGVSSVVLSDGSEMDIETLTVDANTKTPGNFKVTANISGPAGEASCSATYTVEAPLTCSVVSSNPMVYVGAPTPIDSTTLTITPSIAITALTLDGATRDKTVLSFMVKPTSTHEYTVGVASLSQNATCKVNVLVTPRYSR